MDKQIVKTEILVEKLLGKQKRGDGSSNAQHAKRVRALLIAALKEAKETPPPLHATALECAALGHDLLEDSPITKKEIIKLAGKESLSYIEELTNTWGDTHKAPYIKQMVQASEEARLIKYADLTDNLFHASYQTASLGKKWMKSYFLPIVDPMRKALDTTTFKKYAKTAGFLKNSAALARAHLAESVRQIK